MTSLYYKYIIISLSPFSKLLEVTLLEKFYIRLYHRKGAPTCGTINKVPMHMMLPHFAQLLGDAPSLRSVTGGMLPHFAQSLGDAPSLHSVTRGTLPRFAQSLGGMLLASLCHWGDAPLLRSVANIFVPSLHSVTNICSLTSLSGWGDAPSLYSVAFHSMLPSNSSKICILEGQ